jgi:AraC-like DNA-binding protein
MVCAKKISRQGGFGKENEAQAISSNETKILWNDLKTGEQARFLENERLLLASLRRGDGEEAGKIFSAIIEILSEAGSGNFEFFKLHAIQLTVLLSREALSNEARTGPGFSSAPEHSRDAEILEANNRYLKKIEESTDMKELTAIVHAILGHMSGMLFSFHGCRHSSALRRAERFIWENYTRKISLQEIADASGLSAPYFSTIFKDEMGENLSNYLNRLRVEKARGMLTETECPLSEVASSCGFEDQSWFSKIFKSYTGISPGKYREKGGGLPAEKNGEQA